ncbi:MAG: hypothetical protein M1816_000645 [Peltula sp. TS41687]|nr:MAG: hypothetical protein M1816_000645 [Peltula sp. TS41687]
MSHPRDMYGPPPAPGEAPPPLPLGPPPGLALPTLPFAYPPLPLGVPPGVPSPMYTFGPNHSTLPGFSFQPSHGPSAQFPGPNFPLWPSQPGTLPPSQGPSRPYEEQRWGPRQPQRDGFRQERRYERLRGRSGIHAPSQRPLLTSQRGSTPEPMSAMTEDSRAGKRFISLDDLSDSEEEEMDTDSQSETNTKIGDEGRIRFEQPSPEESNEPPRKRRAQGDQFVVDAAFISVPKWSNPDPYTALPPPDESQKKKKDVVKLIRKARVASTQRDSPSNGLENNVDFISLNFGDEAGEDVEIKQEDVVSDDTQDIRLKAPSGPRSLIPNTQIIPPLSGPGDVTFPHSVGNPQTSLQEHPAVVDAALGSRKRTHRDEIKETGPPQPVVQSEPPTDPGILNVWRAKGNVNPVPWPRKFEQEVRENLLERLRSVVVSGYPDSDIRCFGSFPAGIYLPTADMDVVCVTNHLLTTGRPKPGLAIKEKLLRKFVHLLESKGLTRPGSIEVIAKAKVPIVKFVDALTNLRVDVSFENTTGIVAIDTYLTWKAQYPAMPIIVTIIKQFLAMRGLHEVRYGGLGGFSITCMVTSMLQNMPQVQSGHMIPENHLGDILMEFLDLYGNKFNSVTTGIRLSPPGYFDKLSAPNQPYRKPSNRDRLTIEDPNNPNNDISGGSKRIRQIFSSFSRAYDGLQEKMFKLYGASFTERRGQSLLGTILAGNYSSFELQRHRLRRVHEGRSDEVSEPSPIILNNTVQRQPDESSPSVHDNAEIAEAENDVVAPPLPIVSTEARRRKLAEKRQRKKARKQKEAAEPMDMREQRAQQLRRDFPHIQNIPAQVGKREGKILRKGYARRTGGQKAQQRAQQLRREFPHIQNIPAKVGKSVARTLRKQYAASAGVPSDLQQGQASDPPMKAEDTNEATKAETKPKSKSKSKRQRSPEQSPGALEYKPIQKRVRTSDSSSAVTGYMQNPTGILTRAMRKRLRLELPKTKSDGQLPMNLPDAIPTPDDVSEKVTPRSLTTHRRTRAARPKAIRGSAHRAKDPQGPSEHAFAGAMNNLSIGESSHPRSSGSGTAHPPEHASDGAMNDLSIGDPSYPRTRRSRRAHPGEGGLHGPSGHEAAGTLNSLFTGESSRHFPSAETRSIKSEGPGKVTQPWKNQLLQAGGSGSNGSGSALSVKREMDGIVVPSIFANNLLEQTQAFKPSREQFQPSKTVMMLYQASKPTSAASSTTTTATRAVIKAEDVGDLIQTSQWTPVNTPNMVTRSEAKPAPTVKSEVTEVQLSDIKKEMITSAQIHASGAGAHIKGNDSASSIVKEEVRKEEAGMSTKNPIMLD